MAGRLLKEEESSTMGPSRSNDSFVHSLILLSFSHKMDQQNESEIMKYSIPYTTADGCTSHHGRHPKRAVLFVGGDWTQYPQRALTYELTSIPSKVL